MEPVSVSNDYSTKLIKPNEVADITLAASTILDLLNNVDGVATACGEKFGIKEIPKGFWKALAALDFEHGVSHRLSEIAKYLDSKEGRQTLLKATNSEDSAEDRVSPAGLAQLKKDLSQIFTTFVPSPVGGECRDTVANQSPPDANESVDNTGLVRKRFDAALRHFDISSIPTEDFGRLGNVVDLLRGVSQVIGNSLIGVPANSPEARGAHLPPFDTKALLKECIVKHTRSDQPRD